MKLRVFEPAGNLGIELSGIGGEWTGGKLVSLGLSCRVYVEGGGEYLDALGLHLSGMGRRAGGCALGLEMSCTGRMRGGHIRA